MFRACIRRLDTFYMTFNPSEHVDKFAGMTPAAKIGAIFGDRIEQ